MENETYSVSIVVEQTPRSTLVSSTIFQIIFKILIPILVSTIFIIVVYQLFHAASVNSDNDQNGHNTSINVTITTTTDHSTTVITTIPTKTTNPTTVTTITTKPTTVTTTGGHWNPILHFDYGSD